VYQLIDDETNFLINLDENLSAKGYIHFDDGEQLPFTDDGVFALLENNLSADLTSNNKNLTITSTVKYMQNEDDFNREYTTLKQAIVFDAKFHKLDAKVLSCTYWENSSQYDCLNKIEYLALNSGALKIYLDKPV